MVRFFKNKATLIFFFLFAIKLFLMGGSAYADSRSQSEFSFKYKRKWEL